MMLDDTLFDFGFVFIVIIFVIVIGAQLFML